MPGVDYIFHAAALKQVPSCEFFPMEAVKTNVVGTDNVLTAAIEEGVEAVICLSTDKAAYPINAMGITKSHRRKSSRCKEPYVRKNKDLLHPLWKCYVFPRLRYSSLDRSDQGWKSDHCYRTFHDPFLSCLWMRLLTLFFFAF